MRRAGRRTSGPTTAASTPSTSRPAPSAGHIAARRRRTPRRDRPRPGLHRHRRRPDRRARAGDRKVALAIRTRHARGFTIHGYAGPRLRGQQVLSGFADGYFVALSAASGEVVWAKSLAAASDQFVDVDSTPALTKDAAYVSSYSGGLYALDPRDGSVRWRLGIEGVGDVTADADRLYFVAPRYGLHAAHPDGHVLWRQGLSEAGDLRPRRRRELPDLLGQPRRHVRRRSRQRRAAGDLQPRARASAPRRRWTSRTTACSSCRTAARSTL